MCTRTTCIHVHVHVHVAVVRTTYFFAHAVVECALQLVSVAKEMRGDPGNHEGGQSVSESAEWVVSGLRELREIAEDAHSDSGLIAGEITASLEC